MKSLTFSLVSALGLFLTPICAADEVIFKDGFAGKLGEGWTWMREDKSAWRISEAGLKVRVRPGSLWGPANNVGNVLVRPAPDPTQGEVEVSVTVANKPTHQYEQANVAWYYDDSNMVKLGLELVNGEVCIVMGREQADKTRTLAKIPIEAYSVRLRLRVTGNEIRGQYMAAGSDKWLDAGTGDLPAPPNVTAKISLHCYQGAPDTEHWAGFTDFQVVGFGK